MNLSGDFAIHLERRQVLNLPAEKWKRAAYTNLADLASLMERRQIPFWLDYSTLLGAYRDGVLVQRMVDIDLGLFGSSWPEVRSGFQELAAAGFKIREKQFCLGDATFHSANCLRHGVNVDLSGYVVIDGEALDLHSRYSLTQLSPLSFVYQRLPFSPALRFALRTRNKLFSLPFYYVDVLPPKARFGPGKASRWALGRPSYYTAKVPASFFSDFARVNLGGREYPVPRRTEEYLGYLYGPRWGKPDPTYRTWDARWFYVIVAEKPIEREV